MPTCVPVIEVTALAVQDVQVPVRLVMMPEAGVPRAGVTRVGEVANTMLPVPVAPDGVIPPIEMSVPKVCFAVQVFAFARSRDATTEPMVGEMVSVPSELATEFTAPLPPEPHAAPVFDRNPVESI